MCPARLWLALCILGFFIRNDANPKKSEGPEYTELLCKQKHFLNHSKKQSCQRHMHQLAIILTENTSKTDL